MKLIIEGMDHDNTRLNYVVREADVPKDTTAIKINFGDYKFDLVGRFTNDGVIKENSTRNGREIILHYVPIYAPESPQSIITEDNRIYSWADKKRLEATLRDIFETAGSFDEAYRQIQAEPHKFYC